ncbi:MAG: hypothetical protein DWI59_06580 [Chloroflexi bacterium]|nr:MAG: hypothetical protein DWI59_06580 [Chloroflexota bacterium]
MAPQPQPPPDCPPHPPQPPPDCPPHPPQPPPDCPPHPPQPPPDCPPHPPQLLQPAQLPAAATTKSQLRPPFPRTPTRPPLRQ